MTFDTNIFKVNEPKGSINFYLRGNDLITLSSHPRFIHAWHYKDNAPDEYGKIEHENFWGIYHVNNEPIKEANISKWLMYPTRKPNGDRLCFTYHMRSGRNPVICTYRKNDDVFLENGPENYNKAPIAVTHFIELPYITEAQ